MGQYPEIEIRWLASHDLDVGDPDKLTANTTWIHKNGHPDLDTEITRTRHNTLGMYLAESVAEETKQAIWMDGVLRIYSAGSLEG